MATRRLVFVSLVSASALLGGARVQGQCTFLPSVVADYAPPEVIESHPSQVLTVFLPNVPPPPDRGLYPTILYSPAAIFSATEAAGMEEGFRYADPLFLIGDDPGGGGPSPAVGPVITCNGFLAEALKAGWAVVSAGTTGWDSWPTCSQDNDCNPCFNDPDEDPGCAVTAGCWDTNLWYPPDAPQWDDFNAFWGEKDFLWARQWVAENAAALGLDDARVVACGTSTGAIYGAFLAYGPNRAWDASHSPQAQRDTRVAALVAFEPNTWMRALRSSRPGVHWPSSEDGGLLCGPTGFFCPVGSTESCYNRRAQQLGGGSGGVAPGVLEASSISRWVRVLEDPSERPTPTFVATGDGQATTGFQRNANVPPYTGDYDRHLSSPLCGTGEGEPTLIPGDPLLAFTDPDELRLHDSWFAVNFRVDLTMLDGSLSSSFHANRSSLFLQNGHAWGFLPGCLSKTGVAPVAASDVLGLDGTFANEGAGVLSIENSDLAPQVLAWLEAELSVERTPQVISSNPVVAGPGGIPNANFSSFQVGGVAIGVPTDVEIDLGRSPGYEKASVMITLGAAPAGSEPVLASGQVVLCDLSTFLGTTAFYVADPDGVVRFQLAPASPGSTTFCLQAVLKDAQGQMPFALTNAQLLDFTQ